MRLGDTSARFTIPPLGDKPTNPIVDNLSALDVAFTKKNTHSPPSWATSLLGPARDDQRAQVEPAEDDHEPSSSSGGSRPDSLIDWEAATGIPPPTLLAWNAPDETRPSAFASEQHVHSWDEPSTSSSAAPISARALTPLLVQVALGSSSAGSAVWNENKKRFDWVGQVETLSQQTAQSFVAPFLETGTYLIRLSELAAQLAVSPLSSSSTHAFSHALSSYLTFLQNELQAAANTTSLAPGHASQPPSRKGKERASSGGLLELQARWRILGQVVSALADLGGVNTYSPPRPPTSLYKTTPLLSRIYCHLTSHVHSASSLHLQAALAWLLDRTSVSWVDKVSKWIGILAEDAVTERDGWVEVGAHRVELVKGVVDYRFDPVSTPAFVPEGAARNIFEAGRSLRLLRQARPDHPLCKAEGWGMQEDTRPRWLWNDVEIEELRDTVKLSSKRLQKNVSSWRRRLRRMPSSRSSIDGDGTTTGQSKSRASPSPSTRSKPQVQSTANLPPATSLDFAALLDMCTRPPGSGTFLQLASSPSVEVEDQSSKIGGEAGPSPFIDDSSGPRRPSDLCTFLARLLDCNATCSRPFLDEPNLLPPCAPTLPILTSLTVFPPLLSYGGLVSQSLLSIYFGDLDLLGHLEILNRFLLLADPSFTRRVKRSVFGDGDNLDRASQSLGHGARSRVRARLGMTPSKKAAVEGAKDQAASEWGVGLGLGLSERQSWPPGGSELAFALRATMMDSVAEMLLEKEVEAKWDGQKSTSGMWDDVETRIGFSIRDVEEAGEAWKDPQAIEALDFLYINYRPPSTIAVLFPAEILAKYHKIQTFILRLFRVETVTRSLFTSTTRPSSKLFVSSVEAQRKLFSLRIETSHFVNNLAGYVFDTAIGRNWKVFIKRLERLRSDSAGRRRARRAADEDEESGDDSDELEEDEAGAGGAELKDVLSLVLYHSTVLDRMLAACFLRTKQHTLYTLLMRCFTLILTFGKLVRDLETQAIDEEDAYSELLQLHDDFAISTADFLAAVRKIETSRSSPAATPGGEAGGDLEALLEGEEKSALDAGGRRGAGAGFASLVMRLDWRGQRREER